MKKQALKIFTFATALTIALMFSFTNNAMQDSNLDNPVTGLSTLERAYQEWQAKNVNNTHILNVQLGWIKGLSSEPSDAVGTARLNQTNGTISLRIKDIKDGDWQLWFIENHPEGSTIPEATDKIVEGARFTSKDGIVDFEGKIDLALIDKMEIDRIAITRTGINPAEAFVLSGSPTLFERLQRRELLARRTESSIASRLVSWFTPTASADKKDDLTRLIEDGKKLFNEEKFKGNGRTCATCHPASNNFTIDPAFIATLPPNDPLFVAEFDPNLANNFENPALMRQFGLILENVDGFEDLQNKFVMRSVNHTLGMSQSLNAPDPVFGIDFTTNGVNPNPTQRTGWGGDGSPGSGSLREFAIGAVIQHFPKTLSRTPGSDFRLPTDRELDAMEAFQLSLGRQEEVNIRTLSVRDGLANNGKTLFLDTGNIGQRGRKNCNACHFNAGATTGFALNTQAPGFTPLLDGVALGFNGNQGTNTIALPQVAALGLPVDGGFGKTPLPNGGFGTFAVIGGNNVPIRSFNSPSLIEAADTPPFFHHHLVATLEEAVAFYGSAAFNGPGSIGAGPVPVSISSNPNDPEVQAISAFLRLLNAVENIRSTVSIAQTAQQTNSVSKKRDLIRLALADNNDAIEVLTSGAYATNRSANVNLAIVKLQESKARLEEIVRGSASGIDQVIGVAILAQREARAALVDPNTLPVSFKN